MVSNFSRKRWRSLVPLSMATNNFLPNAQMCFNNKLVIIGFADALSAPEVAFSLLDAGFRVAAFIRHNSNPPALRKCKDVKLFDITSPEEDAHKTVIELNGIYKSLQATAIMPLNDRAVWLCNKLAGEHKIKVAGPTGMHAQFSLDKRIQINAALNAGFNVPETILIESIEDARHVINFPVVLKPALAVAEDANQLIKKESLNFCVNNKEFQKIITAWSGKQPLLAQVVHSGVGEGLFGFATENGIIALSAHQRVRMLNPKGSGSSACRAMPFIDYPVKNVEDMLLKIKWHGIFMVEMLRDKYGKSWFIELNGRPWGSMALARRMDFEYPAWSIMQILDPAFRPETPVPREYVTCRHLGRELIHILQVLRGPSSAAIPNWPSFWRTLFTIFKISRNDCWYNWNPRNKVLFLADTYDTIMNETLRKIIKS
jgi:hypothetical protein